MTHGRRAALLGMLLVGVGCQPREQDRQGTANAAASEASAPVTPKAASSAPSRAEPLPRAAAVEPFLVERPVRSKSIGHTSVVLRVDFPGGVRAAFKPRSRKGADRFRGEVAAYRLGFHLGLTEVPPCFLRTFSAQEFRASLGDDTQTWEQVLPKDGKVQGALIPWIDGLSFAPLEKDPMRSAWQAALFDGKEIPEAERLRMRQIARMLVFDTVTGNWDRFSGGNVGLSKDGSLLFIDNDGAFLRPFPQEAFKLQEGYSKRLTAFPQGLMSRLRELDDATLARVLGDDDEGAPLLSTDVRKDVLTRAQALVAQMDRLGPNESARALP
jgi:hypothetical protein